LAINFFIYATTIVLALSKLYYPIFSFQRTNQNQRF